MLWRVSHLRDADGADVVSAAIYWLRSDKALELN